MNDIRSPYGEGLDPNRLYEEHPNPYFERKLYMPLNGEWDFLMSKDKKDRDYGEKILVPFAVETRLSGINRKVEADDYLVYRREVRVPENFKGKSLLVNFTFVDQVAEVYWNGQLLGTHEGGYLPFSFKIDRYKDVNVLEVIVQDDTDSPVYPRGKQSNDPKGIWYTPTSGIYGPVYLEAVPSSGYVTKLTIKPDLNRKSFKVDCAFAGKKGEAVLCLYHDGDLVSRKCFSAKAEVSGVEISAVGPKGEYFVYDLDNPNLYEMVLSYNGDEVSSSCALRQFSIVGENGRKAFALNGKPLYVSAVLDQGYFPESGLTPPSYKAMEGDIALLKRLGFNALRKHIKLEVPRFYYLCDKMGMLVAQDFVNGGSKYNPFLIVAAPFIHLPIKDNHYSLLGRKEKKGRDYFYSSVYKTQDYLFNSASLFMYTVFNEGWGQFDSESLTDYAYGHDPTRLYDAASGWFDQGAGDFCSRHVYFRRVRLRHGKDRILSLSEFGGYSYAVKGHTYGDKAFGYKLYRDPEKLERGFEELFVKDLFPNIRKHGLAMSVLTQLSDVEGEINGLVTYDRRVLKCDGRKIAALNEEAQELFLKGR